MFSVMWIVIPLGGENAAWKSAVKQFPPVRWIKQLAKFNSLGVCECFLRFTKKRSR